VELIDPIRIPLLFATTPDAINGEPELIDPTPAILLTNSFTIFSFNS
jgi:hypothetical protein